MGLLGDIGHFFTQTVASGAQTAVSTIESGGQAAVSTIETGGKAAVSTLETGAKSALDTMQEEFGNVLSTSQIQTVLDNISKIEKLGTYFTTIDNLMTEVGGDIAHFPTYIQGKMDTAKDNAVNEIKNNITTIASVSKYFGYIDSFLKEIGGDINDFPDYIKKKMEDAKTDAVNEIKNNITTIASISKYFGYIDSFLKEIGGDITQFGHYMEGKMTGLKDEFKDATTDIGKFINKIKSEAELAAKKAQNALISLEKAGIKLEKELERDLHKVIDYAKKLEKNALNKIKKEFNKIKDKIKHFVPDLLGIIDKIFNFLNSYLDYLDTLYFIYSLFWTWIALALLFALYGSISIWEVFGPLSTTVRYVLFYGILYYLYLQKQFTLVLEIDKKHFLKHVKDFLVNFFKNIKSYWKKFVSELKWLYFIIWTYLYAVFFSIIILLTEFVVPFFNILGPENAIYMRNVVFYGIMYYFYQKKTFTLVNDPIQQVHILWNNLSNPKDLFKSLGDGFLNFMDGIISLVLFAAYWILLTLIFMTYDNFNIWEVFGEYEFYATNIVFYSIMYVLGTYGCFSISSSVKEVYSVFKNLSWKGVLQSWIEYIKIVYVIVSSFVFAILISAVIFVLSLLTSVFDLLGEDNNIYLRNLMFYVPLSALYYNGFMTLDVDYLWSFVEKYLHIK